MSAAEKQRQAMQLREAGVFYEQIAEIVGYGDRSGAYKAVMAGLKAARLEPATSLRRLELSRIDRLFVKLWQLATGNPPDFGAIDRCVKLMQRRAALAGLDISPAEKGKETSDKKKYLHINWDELYERQRRRPNPIEERIKQAREGIKVDALPKPSNGQANLPANPNGACHG
jgi:hypothetical protein